MTPGAIIGVLSSHGFAGDRAGPDLGYTPLVPQCVFRGRWYWPLLTHGHLFLTCSEEGRQRTLKEFIASLPADGGKKGK